MDIVITKKIEDKEIKTIKALQNYAEDHGYAIDRIVFAIGGFGDGR